MKNIAVFVSGGGSNLQTLIDGCASGYIDGRIVAVISSKEGVYALERAKAAEIPHFVFQKRDYPDVDSLYRGIIEILEGLDTDIIVLAGYLSILNGEIVRRYRNRIVNIHPSLIPSFCGMGYYGIKVHEAVLSYGCKVTGATVHFVDEGADTGPIILQEAVEVKEGDTPKSLQQRVLEAEHRLLPYAVKLLCEDRVTVTGRTTKILKQR